LLGLAGGTGAVSLLLNVWASMAPSESETRELIEGLSGVGGTVILVLTPIMYLMWLHRVVRQLNALGLNVGATPGWAVGFWFVP
jgi:hypothetical protein